MIRKASDDVILGRNIKKKGVYISNMKTAFEEKKDLFKKYIDQQLGGSGYFK